MFRTSNLEVLTQAEIPLPIKTSTNQQGLCSDENVNRILKYIYHNQDFKTIKSEINATNVSSLYSQAYVMKCQNLLKSLDEMIINELLNPDNSTMFYLDAIRVSELIAINNKYYSLTTLRSPRPVNLCFRPTSTPFLAPRAVRLSS